MKSKWNFNCFSSGRESEIIKPSLLDKRSKHGRKSLPSKVKIDSERAESRVKGQAFVRIVSFSHGGEVIPVAFVSPNGRSFDAPASVKSQKTDQFGKAGEEKGRRVDEQSWVRIVVKESALSSPKIRTVQKAPNTARDSTPRPQDAASKENAAELKKPLVNFLVRKVEGYNLAISLSVFIMILASLLWGKFVAIACTCMWCYTIPVLRSMAKLKKPAGIQRDSRNRNRSLIQSHLHRTNYIKG
ncbi:hypothetical protein SUGI_0657410 [Cryptomeria japonica]|nr:hypothetical protein SUGI_0657410 [Cryptomeria japonica]